MWNQILNVIMILLLCFCGLWIVAADGMVDSLRNRLNDEQSKREALNRENVELEKALVRTRVQLNSLINANADLSSRMGEMQEKIRNQEEEVDKIKSANTNERQSSSIGNVIPELNDMKTALAQSQLEREAQRDSILFWTEYSKFLSEKIGTCETLN